jgi:hypothetical protein
MSRPPPLVERSGNPTNVVQILTALEPTEVLCQGAPTAQWEPPRIAFLTAALTAKETPNLFETEAVVERLRRWLRPGLPMGLSNAVFACAALSLSLQDRDVWPVALLEAFVRDLVEGLGGHGVTQGHRWSDHPECATFVDNLRTAWKISPAIGGGGEYSLELLVRPRVFVGTVGDGLGSMDKELYAGPAGTRRLLSRLLMVVKRRTAVLESADTCAGAGGALALLKVHEYPF